MTAARRAGVVVALVVGTVALYGAVRTHDFVNLDDRVFILQNPTLPLGWTWEGIRQAVATRLEAYWIPVTALSFQASWALHGYAPAGYLLTNVLLHASSTALLFLALERMTGAVARSAVVAALFAVHPLHVESVAWASERKDVLSGLFFMTGLRVYANVRGDRLTRGQRWGVFAALVLGCLAKPMLVTMPFVLLLLDRWPLDRPMTLRRVTEKAPLFVAVGVFAALTMYTQAAHGALEFGRDIGLGRRVANALDAWVWYVRATLWPAGLTVFYPYPAAPDVARVLLEAAALAAVTLAALSQTRRRPWWPVGWLWYVGMLVPVIGLVQAGMQARADRFVYLPIVGLLLPLAWSCPRRALLPAAGVAVAALATVTWIQIGYWRDTIALFERAVAVTADNYYAHARLGEEYRAAGLLDVAEGHYREAVRLAPEWGGAHRMLASLRAARGDAAEAERLYGRATALDPEDVQAWGDLGMLRFDRGAWGAAAQALGRAAAIDPRSADLALHLGVAAARAGDQKTARDALERAHELVPADPRATSALAWLLASAADDAVWNPGRALLLIEPLLRAQPGVVEWLDTLAAAQAGAGRFHEAVATALDARARAAARGDGASVAQLDRRLERYRAGAPYREARAGGA